VSDLIRSFIAVKIPADAADRIRAAQQQLRATGPDVKWVDPDNLHITLKFLGDVERPRLDSLWQSTAEGLNGATAFTMRFHGVGAFPDPDRPRVVWVGIAGGAEELRELAAGVEAACERHGFEREKRPFRAHVTLGRVRRPAPNPALAAAMADHAQTDLGEAYVDRVLLMRSELTRTGAVHSMLQQVLLHQGDS